MQENLSSDLTRPIANAWLGCIGEADAARRKWKTAADLCRRFYSGGCGFMWEDEFHDTFFANQPAWIKPRFRVDLNKTYEYVAITGPSLYWNDPYRQVVSPERISLFPELYGDVDNDPQAAELFQQTQKADESERRINKMRNSAFQAWLNFTQREQPGGGLEGETRLTIDDALIDGRGVMVTKVYQYPGSDKKLTGSFSVPPRDLFIDPDCSDITLRDARWIAIQHNDHASKVEKMFDLPAGSLHGKGMAETRDSKGRNRTPADDNVRKSNDRSSLSDMIQWYEIYSKCGAGSRNLKARNELDKALDAEVGNYARICVARNVDFLLNLPANKLEVATADDIREAFAWPVPYWLDDAWPITTLDFYTADRTSAWPLPPLWASIGPLMCINVLTSLYLSKAWDNSQTIIAYLASLEDKVKQKLASGDPVVEIKLDGVNSSIKECVQILERGRGGEEGLLNAIAAMQQRFNESSGLNELSYGGTTGAQSRSAADSQFKQEATMRRADDMASKVAKHQASIADHEKIAAFWSLKRYDVEPAIGLGGGEIWERLIETADPEVVLRSTRAIVDVQDIQRPDRKKNLVNLTTASGYQLPVYQAYAAATGDTGPLNAFNQAWFDAAGIEADGLELGPWEHQQPPDDGGLSEQMQQIQLQAAKTSVDKDASAAELNRAKAQQAMQEASIDESETRSAETEQRIATAQEMHKHQMIMKQQSHQLGLAQQIQNLQMRQKQGAA